MSTHTAAQPDNDDIPFTRPTHGQLRFGLDDRLPAPVLLLAAMQWVLFVLPGILIVPVVLAHMLHVPPAKAAAYANLTLFLTGVASLLQVRLGHRMPLIEGPAALWWAVFIALIESAPSLNRSGLWVMQNLQGAVLVAGGMLVLIGALRCGRLIRTWFTPAVTGTFFVLLSVQVSGPIVRGMLGVVEGGGLRLLPGLVAAGTLALVLVLARVGPGLVRNFAVLIGLVAGWLAAAALGLAAPPAAGASSAFAVPDFFPWGPPGFDTAFVLTAAITGLVNLSNVLGSMVAAEQVMGGSNSPRFYDRSIAWSGAGTVLAATGGGIGTAPFAASAGFVGVTGLAARRPFVLAALVLALLGLFPGIGAVMAALPVPVGNAVLLVAFIQIFTFGLGDLTRLALNQRDAFRVAMPILIGSGLLLLPVSAFASVPVTLRFLLANGTLIGTVLALLLDRARVMALRPRP